MTVYGPKRGKQTRSSPSAIDQLDAETGAQCYADDCRVSFRVLAQHLDTIGDGVDALGGQVRDLDARITAMGERMSAQEMSTRSLWHEVRTIGDRLSSIPERVNERIDDRVSDALRTHAADCAGRELAKHKLNRDSDRLPRMNRYDENHPRVELKLDSLHGDRSGFVIPRWVILVAAGIGIAIAVAGYTIGKLVTDGYQSAPAVIQQVEKAAKRSE